MTQKIGISFLISLLIFSTSFGINEKFKSGESSTTSSKSSSSRVMIKPVSPTHYAFISTAKVNNIAEFVISPREISGGLGSNFMLFASPWNGRIGSGDGEKWGSAISDTRIGLKYQFSSNILLGGGLNVENGQSGLAFFLVTPILSDGTTEIVFSPSGVFKLNKKGGNNNGWHSIGFGLGGEKEISDLFEIIGEVRFANQFETDAWVSDSETTTISHGMIGLTGALRIVVPPIPFMYFDLGLDTQQYIYNGGAEFLGAYLDIGFGFSL